MRQIKSKQFFQLHLAAAGGESDGCKRGLGWAGWQLVDVMQVASGARSSLPRGCHLTLACLSQWQQTHTYRQMYPEKERWGGGEGGRPYSGCHRRTVDRRYLDLLWFLFLFLLAPFSFPFPFPFHFLFLFPACTSSSTGHQWQRVALLNMAT